MTDTLSDDLLRQAINSILHGSTHTVAQTDATGNLTYQEVILLRRLVKLKINSGVKNYPGEWV